MTRNLPKDWPHSKNNKYSPSVETVTAALKEQQEKAKKRPAISPFYRSRLKVNQKRYSYEHILMDKIRLHHAQGKRRTIGLRTKSQELFYRTTQRDQKELALTNAKLYYNCLREQVKHYTKSHLLLYVKQSAQKLKEKHHSEYRLFLEKLQRERYYVTNLYEDFYMPIYYWRRRRLQWTSYENIHRRLLFLKLAHKQKRSLRLFLHKQRGERFLNFLTFIRLLALYQKEQRAWVRSNNRTNVKPFFYL